MESEVFEKFNQQLLDLLDLQTLVANRKTQDHLRNISKLALTTILYPSPFLLIKEELEKVEVILSVNHPEPSESAVRTMITEIGSFQNNRSIHPVRLSNIDWCDGVICVSEDEEKFFLCIQKPDPSAQLDQFLVNYATTIMLSFSNIKLLKENYEKGKAESELKNQMLLAQEIQSKLLDHETFTVGKYSIDCEYKPHYSVGGDYYDFFSNQESSYVIVADVAGKGVSAALIISGLQAYFKVLAEQNLPLDQFVIQLNRYVNELTKGERFISAFVMRIQESQVDFVNAGHLPPLFKQKDEIQELTNGCPVLGMLPELPFVNAASIQMNSGDQILLFTDGLIEVWNEKEEMLPDDFLIRSVQNKGIIDRKALKEDVLSFAGEKGFMDDVTILVLNKK